MHQLIIVDRQRSNHMKIRKYLEETDLEYTIVAEVTSAEDAENVLKENPIDLIIADDTLPRKSGLQLYIDNKEAYNGLHMILFTDYNRFNNTRDTYTDGRIDYLFKPIRRNDVVKSLMQMDKLILDFDRRKQEQFLLRESYDANLEVFKDRFLINLIHGHVEDDLQILDQLDYFKIPHGTSYVVGVMKIDEYRKYQLALDEDEKQFLIFKALNVINNYLDSHNLGFSFINRYDEICYIITVELDDEVLFDHCYAIQDVLMERLSLRGTIGLGHTYSRPSFISVSYEQARAAINHNFYLGLGSIIHIDYVAKDTDLAFNYPSYQEHYMVDHVVNGNANEAIAILDKLFQALRLANTLPRHYYSLLIIDILVTINRRAAESNVSIENFFKHYLQLNEINAISTADEAQDYLKKALMDICKYQEEKRGENKEKLLEEILNYVSSYYANKISLKRAAEYLKTTPQYLESLIYQRYDKTFFDYCMFVRLSKAKELLRTTNYTTTEISAQIGFNSSEYFVAIFRQQVHMSPSEYRHQSKFNPDL